MCFIVFFSLLYLNVAKESQWCYDLSVASLLRESSALLAKLPFSVFPFLSHTHTYTHTCLTNIAEHVINNNSFLEIHLSVVCVFYLFIYLSFIFYFYCRFAVNTICLFFQKINSNNTNRKKLIFGDEVTFIFAWAFKIRWTVGFVVIPATAALIQFSFDLLFVFHFFFYLVTFASLNIFQRFI